MGDKSGGDYFVVYWYPTIFHREKQRREDAIMDFEDISDKSDLPLMVKKEEIGKDMKYTLLFKNSGTEIIFWLIYDGNRRNGFTIYKYDRAKLREDLKRAIKGSVVKAIQDGKISFSSEEDLNVALDKYSDTTLDKYIDKIFEK